MPYFNIVAQSSECTVVTEYEPVKNRSEEYQSEAELEAQFIKDLTSRDISICLYTMRRSLYPIYARGSKRSTITGFPMRSGTGFSRIP